MSKKQTTDQRLKEAQKALQALCKKYNIFLVPKINYTSTGITLGLEMVDKNA